MINKNVCFSDFVVTIKKRTNELILNNNNIDRILGLNKMKTIKENNIKNILS